MLYLTGIHKPLASGEGQIRVEVGRYIFERTFPSINAAGLYALSKGFLSPDLACSIGVRVIWVRWDTTHEYLWAEKFRLT